MEDSLKPNNMAVSVAKESSPLDRTVESNPFHVSERDEDVFGLREEERNRRAKAREDNRNLKIWQKGRTGALADEQSGRRWLGEMLADDGGSSDIAPPSGKAAQIAEKLDGCANYYIPSEKESMADFIAKKREMFLLQMSLNIKKDEIRKLEEKAHLKEDALQRSEQMLEEDAVRFDAFLKENDKRTQDSMRKAEKETKRKMEKVQEIKKLNQQIQMIQADINKNREALDECLRHKQFLNGLTPPEWVDSQLDVKRARQRRRRRERIAKRKEQWKVEQEHLLQKAKEQAEAENSKSRRRRKRGKKQEEGASQMELPPEPDFEDEPMTSSDEEMPMYFEKSDQLMDIFATLEEKNLFLIQSMQEAEQSLEELEQDYADTKEDMTERTSALEANIRQLRNTVDREEGRGEELRQRANSRSGYSSRNENLLASLDGKVNEIYRCLGLSDAGSSPSTLFMLSDIEARMEDVLSSIDDMPADYVKKAEKVKGKQRRESKRAIKQEAQERAQEERNRKALERCMQPPKKRVGKPVMYRSHLVRKKKVEEDKRELTQDELDELRHLTPG